MSKTFRQQQHDDSVHTTHIDRRRDRRETDTRVRDMYKECEHIDDVDLEEIEDAFLDLETFEPMRRRR